MRTIIKILFSIAAAFIVGLIFLIILGIVFHPKLSADSSVAVKAAVVTGETMGAYLSYILIVGGVSAGYLAATSQERHRKITYAILGFLMLALSISTFVYSDGHLPLG